MKGKKIQITLSDEEMFNLSRKAAFLGYNVTKFVKLLASREALRILEDSMQAERGSKKPLFPDIGKHEEVY